MYVVMSLQMTLTTMMMLKEGETKVSVSERRGLELIV